MSLSHSANETPTARQLTDVARSAAVTKRRTEFVALLDSEMFSVSTIKVIQEEHSEPFQHTRAMLEKWCNEMDRQATRRKIIEALLQMGLTRPARKVFGKELVEFVRKTK